MNKRNLIFIGVVVCCALLGSVVFGSKSNKLQIKHVQIVSTSYNLMLYEKLETSYFALKFSSAQNQIMSIAPSLCGLILPL